MPMEVNLQPLLFTRSPNAVLAFISAVMLQKAARQALVLMLP